MTHPGATALSYTHLSADDARDLAHLHHVIAETDGAMWPPSASEVAENLAPSSTFDPALDTWAVWAGTELVAFAEVLVRSSLSYDGSNNVHVLGGVHPAWRGRGIGSQLLTRAEERAVEKGGATHPGATLLLNCHTTATAPAASSLLTARGYSIARYWFDMVHDLSGELPADTRTQPMTPELYEATRLAHNDAFATHWGSGPISAEGWARTVVGSAGFRPDLSRIAAADGEVLAYAVVSATTPGDAYFELIGVRPSAQRRGLGRAVLTSGLAAIRAEGSFRQAGLDVDADNPTGAGGLYESIGFTNAAKKLTWRRSAN